MATCVAVLLALCALMNSAMVNAEVTCITKDLASAKMKFHEFHMAHLGKVTSLTLKEAPNGKGAGGWKKCDSNSESYGFTDETVWVTKGCKAEFLVCYDDASVIDMDSLNDALQANLAELKTTLERTKEELGFRIRNQDEQIAHLTMTITELEASQLEKCAAIGPGDVTVSSLSAIEWAILTKGTFCGPRPVTLDHKQMAAIATPGFRLVRSDAWNPNWHFDEVDGVPQPLTLEPIDEELSAHGFMKVKYASGDFSTLDQAMWSRFSFECMGTF